jgi:hypothetical protein
MSSSLQCAKSGLLGGLALIFAGALIAGPSARAATVIVPYAGSFNEATVPAEDGLAAGDYDTIGGNADVGQFNLVAGSNVFMGSIWTPGDSSDFFLINVGANQTLIGATIAFGTNLSPLTPMFAFPPPQWNLSETSGSTTIFDLPVGSNGLTTTANVAAPAFTVGPGFYNMLLGNGTFGISSGNNSTPINYTMTFNVEEKLSVMPLPGALPLLAGGLGLLSFAGWRKKRSAIMMRQRSGGSPQLS